MFDLLHAMRPMPFHASRCAATLLPSSTFTQTQLGMAREQGKRESVVHSSKQPHALDQLYAAGCGPEFEADLT